MWSAWKEGAATVQPQQPSPMTAAGWPLRVRSALQLAACADLLAARFTTPGRPTPVQVDVAISSPARNPELSGALRQTLVLARHLSGRDGVVDQDVLAGELAALWAEGHMGTSSARARQVLQEAALAGHGWRHSAGALHGEQGSFESDAAVRAIAAGLLPQRLSAIAAAARAAAGVTHAHPLAGDGAAILAICLALAARSQCTGIPADRFFGAAAAAATTPQFPSLLPMVRTLVEHRAGPAEAAATLHPGTTTLRTVPAALTAFLRHPGDPAAAIRYALLMAGPNRAIAAMTAALAAASCPHLTIPFLWLPPTPTRVHIRSTASRLADLATRPRYMQRRLPLTAPEAAQGTGTAASHAIIN
jgi:poly(ADP-ribose) glycohydrolase ARH3